MELYKITTEFKEALDNSFNPETGEVDETSLVRLQEIKESLHEKCIAVASYIENLEAEKNAIAEAKKNMADREKKYKSRVDWLKSYLLENMQRAEIKKVTCPYFDITLAKNPPAVEVFDEEAVPTKYERVKIEKDVQKIRDDLLAGVIIPGARLIQRQSVRIK